MMRLSILSTLLIKTCLASEPSLIQYDPDASERQQETDAVAASIQNELRTHTTYGQTFELNHGPVPYPESLAESMIIQETLLFQSNANPDLGLIYGIAESFNITTVDDYDAMYAALEPVIPIPLTRDFSDEAFARDRLTLKGSRLRAVSWYERLDRRLRASPAYSVCGIRHVGKLKRWNRLFVEDLSFVGEYNDPAAPSKYAPSSMGYFCVAKHSDEFLPLAVHLLDTDIIYFPSDSEDDWTLAKMALNAASINVQQMDHFIETHMMLEPIRVELLRSVSDKHPVYKLLEHHFTQLFGNTPAGLIGLLSEGTTYDKTWGWGATGTLRFLQEKLPEASFAEGFDYRMNQAGLQYIPVYPYRDYGQMHWHALEKFLSSYLEPYYSSNLDLELDTELQSWASATCSVVKDFPCHFDCADDVVHTLTSLVFRVTVQHHVMNSDGTHHSISFPFSLPSLNHPLPASKGAEIDFMDYVVPRSELGNLLTLTAFFVRRIGPEVAILGTSYDNVDLGSLSLPAVEDHQKILALIEDEIDYREAHESHPFILMKPSRLPYYVWA